MLNMQIVNIYLFSFVVSFSPCMCSIRFTPHSTTLATQHAIESNNLLQLTSINVVSKFLITILSASTLIRTFQRTDQWRNAVYHRNQ
jgi:hypothetical protein